MGHMSICMVLHYIPTRYLIEPAVFKVKKIYFVREPGGQVPTTCSRQLYHGLSNM